MSVILFSDLGNNGAHKTFDADISNMPPEWDGHSMSCIVTTWPSFPCHFYSEPNFQGMHFKVTGAGGCDDLDTLAGRWRNKIRSIAFGERPMLDGASSEEGNLIDPLFEQYKDDSKFSEIYHRLDNPSIAEAGCVFPGRRVVFFKYGPTGPARGTRVNVVVWNPTYPQYCEGGRQAQMEDMSLICDGWSYDSNLPFAKLSVWGPPA